MKRLLLFLLLTHSISGFHGNGNSSPQNSSLLNLIIRIINSLTWSFPNPNTQSLIINKSDDDIVPHTTSRFFYASDQEEKQQ